MLARIRRWYWRRVYLPARVVSRFLAPDVLRVAEVVDASRIDDGLLTARVRTWKVLYAVRGLSPEPAFGAARTVSIRELWVWSGQPWGGPVPEEPQDAEPDTAPDG